MSQQWQGGGGYQYPQQTGFPGSQQNQFGIGGINPQPTGFPQQFQQQQQPLQTQRTGFPGIQNPGGFQTSNFNANGPGFGGGFSSLNPNNPPPVPPLPSNLGVNRSNVPLQTGAPSFLNTQPPSRFVGPSPLLSQPTGFQQPLQTGIRPLVPQVTGYLDPRLQMMSSSFLPTNISAPYAASGALQLPQNQQLQQSIVQLNQDQRGTC
jgi:actin cytoskeleton-regulatory complex protein PAN1